MMFRLMLLLLRGLVIRVCCSGFFLLVAEGWFFGLCVGIRVFVGVLHALLFGVLGFALASALR